MTQLMLKAFHNHQVPSVARRAGHYRCSCNGGSRNREPCTWQNVVQLVSPLFWVLASLTTQVHNQEAKSDARRTLVKERHACSPSGKQRRQQQALAERELLWHNVLTGTENVMRALPSPSLRHARCITPDDGDDDDEYPFARKSTKIQGVIAACSRGSAADARRRGFHAGR